MHIWPVFIVGFTGVGKTTYGRKLAISLQLPFFDLDECIEQQTRKTIAELFAVFGEEHFRKIESDVLVSLIHKHAVISCGGGTPCFHDNMKLMNNKGHTIWLQSSEEKIFQNLIQSRLSKRPIVQNDTEQELRLWISSKLREREPFYALAKEIIQID